MKLLSLSSNKSSIFPTLYFQDGLNVVFAKINNEDKKNHDSHNLGKTFLIDVLDFMLLGDIKSKNHPFKENSEFEDFEFILEIINCENKIISIKRGVKTRNKISIHESTNSIKDRGFNPEFSWAEKHIPLRNAREILNRLLDLKVLTEGSYTYRKGLGYFLRKQGDFLNVFQLERFNKGGDKDWKPFVTLLLGLNYDLIRQKYELDELIKSLKNIKNILESEADLDSARYDELKGTIEAREKNLRKIEKQIDSFDFKDVEIQVNLEVVNSIEEKISELNTQLYKINRDLNEITQSLKPKWEMNIQEIKDVFNEVAIYFPDSLSKEYSELVDFNKELLDERRKRLKGLQKDKLLARNSIIQQLDELNQKRRISFSLIEEKKSISKFKKMQKNVIEIDKEILVLREKLSRLDSASEYSEKITKKQNELAEIKSQIEKGLREENTEYREIRGLFNEYFEKLTGAEAILAVEINKSGNFEFVYKINDREIEGRITSEAEGTSYKKLLCACFDLALLTHYSRRNFYRFVYHDGIFEGLDNRIKVRMLELIREICSKYNIQYILSVIDTDLPRDEYDKQILFSDEEIIRELSDEGKFGRLFKMDPF